MERIWREQEEMSDESFRAELRAWLAGNITDEFREKRTMTFQEKVAVRRAWQKKLFEAGWIGIGWPKEYGGRAAYPCAITKFKYEIAPSPNPPASNPLGRAHVRHPTPASRTP